MAQPAGSDPPDDRQRLVDGAYGILTRGRVDALRAAEVGEQAGLDEAQVVEHFPGAYDLALAALAQREQIWTIGFVELEARRRGATPEDRLLSIFDAFDDWFSRPDFEACTFINALLEVGAEHPVGVASIRHLEHIRSIIRTLAEEAGLRDVDEFARSWHILMKGSIIAAVEGDLDAAKRAKKLALHLLDDYR